MISGETEIYRRTTRSRAWDLPRRVNQCCCSSSCDHLGCVAKKQELLRIFSGDQEQTTQRRVEPSGCDLIVDELSTVIQSSCESIAFRNPLCGQSELQGLHFPGTAVTYKQCIFLSFEQHLQSVLSWPSF